MPDSVLGTIMVQAGGSAAIGGGSLPSSLTGADREADKAVKLQEGMRKHLAEIEKAQRNQPKMMTKVMKSLGVQLSLAGILKQSQIFTGVLGSIFQILGAMVDVVLAPFVKPVFMPMVKKLASWVPKVQKWAAEMAPKAIEFFKTVGKVLFMLYNFLKDPFGGIGNILKRMLGMGGSGGGGGSGMSGHRGSGGGGSMEAGMGGGMGAIGSIAIATGVAVGGARAAVAGRDAARNVINKGASRVGNLIPDHLRNAGRNIKNVVNNAVDSTKAAINSIAYDEVDRDTQKRVRDVNRTRPPQRNPNLDFDVRKTPRGKVVVPGPGRSTFVRTNWDAFSHIDDTDGVRTSARGEDFGKTRGERNPMTYDEIDNKRSIRARLPDEIKKVATFLENAIKNPTVNAIEKAKAMLATLGTKINQVPGASTALKGALTSLKFVANWVLTPAVMAHQAGETMYDLNSIANSSMPTWMNAFSGKALLKTGVNIANQAAELLSFTDMQGMATSAILGKEGPNRQPFQLRSLQGHKGLFEDTKMLNMLVRGTTGTLGTLLEAAPLVGQILGPVLYEWGRAKTVGSNIPFTDIKLGQGLEEYGIAHGSEGAFEAAVIDLIKQMGQSKTVIQLKDTYGNQNAAGFAVPH